MAGPVLVAVSAVPVPLSGTLVGGPLYTLQGGTFTRAAQVHRSGQVLTIADAGYYSVQPPGPVTASDGAGHSLHLNVQWSQLAGNCDCPCCPGSFCQCKTEQFGADGMGWPGIPAFASRRIEIVCGLFGSGTFSGPLDGLTFQSDWPPSYPGFKSAAMVSASCDKEFLNVFIAFTTIVSPFGPIVTHTSLGFRCTLASCDPFLAVASADITDPATGHVIGHITITVT